MSRRQELRRRIGGLTEISEILGAMKGLALVELHCIGELIDAQRQSVREIEAAVTDLLHFHRTELALTTPPYREVLCILGAERGFCGDFNARLMQAATRRLRAGAAPERIILVGDKLADSWPDGAANTLMRTHAPSVADEVPAALTELLAAIDTLLTERPSVPLHLHVLHHGEDGLQQRQLLPLPEPPPLKSAPAPIPAFPPHLNLAAQVCFAALTDHYLYALLHALFFDSLYEENRHRLQHMDLALHRLDEQLSVLHHRDNRQRQEDIIEEIEVILLTAV